ncbi:hypothetical protein NPIL_66181 [Nephila pilipes]|uniref:Uncharacterized protein n=1 Tax=Nephila pilipes TaxID=299642 RepID=A0A8X6NB61_NEPPI|nr:hypothetical protein NPIL_66181 [Nephila pilipes]
MQVLSGYKHMALLQPKHIIHTDKKCGLMEGLLSSFRFQKDCSAASLSREREERNIFHPDDYARSLQEFFEDNCSENDAHNINETSEDEFISKNDHESDAEIEGNPTHQNNENKFLKEFLKACVTPLIRK